MKLNSCTGRSVLAAVGLRVLLTRTRSFSSSLGVLTVEHMIQLHVERLPEGGYLATSDEVQGLVAQGRTIQETIEIARDVAKKLIEVQSESRAVSLPPVREVFDYPLIVGT
jgi:predicted RNase H-like HicB family nuclease